jgi:hypothetical protein
VCFLFCFVFLLIHLISQAKLHYTEELKLLPADKMHQFYRGRLTKDGRSANSGGSAPEAAAYAAAQLGDGGSSGSSGVVLSTKGRRRFQDLKLPLYGNWCVPFFELSRERTVANLYSAEIMPCCITACKLPV